MHRCLIKERIPAFYLRICSTETCAVIFETKRTTKLNIKYQYYHDTKNQLNGSSNTVLLHFNNDQFFHENTPDIIIFYKKLQFKVRN